MNLLVSRPVRRVGVSRFYDLPRATLAELADRRQVIVVERHRRAVAVVIAPDQWDEYRRLRDAAAPDGEEGA
jgi:hypothetical protein